MLSVLGIEPQVVGVLAHVPTTHDRAIPEASQQNRGSTPRYGVFGTGVNEGVWEPNPVTAERAMPVCRSAVVSRASLSAAQASRVKFLLSCPG